MHAYTYDDDSIIKRLKHCIAKSRQQHAAISME